MFVSNSALFAHTAQLSFISTQILINLFLPQLYERTEITIRVIVLFHGGFFQRQIHSVYLHFCVPQLPQFVVCLLSLLLTT